ncbi:MAG: hypothetical protein AAB874_01215, partial [Patescibacteria group bacterium]
IGFDGSGAVPAGSIIDHVDGQYYLKEYDPVHTCMRPMISFPDESGSWDSYFGSSLWCSITPGFGWAGIQWATNPSTGNPWQISDLDSFGIGSRTENQQRFTEAGVNISAMRVIVVYH